MAMDPAFANVLASENVIVLPFIFNELIGDESMNWIHELSDNIH
jgi:hypothetical protein